MIVFYSFSFLYTVEKKLMMIRNLLMWLFLTVTSNAKPAGGFVEVCHRHI